MTLPLFEQFPGVAALPVAGIAALPTPLQPVVLEGVSDAVGQCAVKRDDATNRLYGGNKVRKLDFLLGSARAEGRRSVVTFGAYGSNHALATAVHARALGLEPHVVMSPQPPTAYARATLLAHARLGTRLHLVDGWDGMRDAARVRRQLAQRDGIEPLVIPMGGTDELGAIGYVNAAFEVGSEFDVVYVASGTLGTAVGLAVGFAALGAMTRTVAVRVTPAGIANLTVARVLADKTIALLRSRDATFPRLDAEELRLELRDEFFEPGYAVPTPQAARAVALARRSGVVLETTYTGKALHALWTDARAGALHDKRVLFWDTYHAGPMPPAGPVSALPRRLRTYVAECERLYPE
ncbi:MAG TPA: pyridoxal-phosphate dependent enzyme [Coriobacteriia bacterium]|nr:pyridoxal-phosphate dependent enzyme [Coriobacteriia bacterium]